MNLMFFMSDTRQNVTVLIPAVVFFLFCVISIRDALSS
jgi:hypothetical protein